MRDGATRVTTVVGRSVANFGTGIRLQLIDALVHARWSYFVAQPVARFTAAMNSDADRAGVAFKSAGMCLVGLMQALVLMFMAVFVSWPFFLGAIVAAYLIGAETPDRRSALTSVMPSMRGIM